MVESSEPGDQVSSDGRSAVGITMEMAGNRSDVKTLRKEEVDIAEAIELTGFGKYHMGLIFACGACMKTLVIESMGVNFVLIAAQREFGLTAAEKGYIAGATFFGMMITAHAWCFIADRIGRKKVLLASFIGTWAANLISSFTPDLWSFIAMRFVVGLFLSGMSFTAYVYLSEFVPAKRQAKFLIWTCAYVVLGFVLVPVNAWLNLPFEKNWDMGYIVFTSWRFYVMIVCISELIDAIMFRRWPETPKFLMSMGKKDEALEVLRKMHKRNAGKTPGEYPVNDLKYEISDRADNLPDRDHLSGGHKWIMVLGQFFQGSWDQTYQLFLPPYGPRTLLFCALQFGISACAGGMYLWLPTILQHMTSNPSGTSSTICEILSLQQSEHWNSTANLLFEMKHVDDIEMAVYSSTLIIGICFAASYAIVGALINLVNTRAILVFGLGVSGAAGIGSVFARNFALLAACMGGHIVVSGTCISVLNAVLVDRYPTDLRPRAYLLTMICGWFGTGIAGTTIGILLEVNCAATFIGIGSLTMSCGLLCMLIRWARYT